MSDYLQAGDVVVPLHVRGDTFPGRYYVETPDFSLMVFQLTGYPNSPDYNKWSAQLSHRHAHHPSVRTSESKICITLMGDAAETPGLAVSSVLALLSRVCVTFTESLKKLGGGEVKP